MASLSCSILHPTTRYPSTYSLRCNIRLRRHYYVSALLLSVNDKIHFGLLRLLQASELNRHNSSMERKKLEIFRLDFGWWWWVGFWKCSGKWQQQGSHHVQFKPLLNFKLNLPAPISEKGQEILAISKHFARMIQGRGGGKHRFILYYSLISKLTRLHSESISKTSKSHQK